MAKTAPNGSAWAKKDVYFPEMQVFATATLSAYRTQTPERFSSYQTGWAEAYIVTPRTPMTAGAGWSFPSVRDNQVFPRTDRLTFWLQVANGSGANPPVSASAVGVIYEYEFEPKLRLDLPRSVRELHLAVYAEDGTVVGTHSSTQLEGGPAFDDDQTREQLLTEAYAVSGRARSSFQIAELRPDEMAQSADFRVDPSTGRAEPLNIQGSDQHPFRS
ncbi:MAG: hypothetical protein ABIW80_11130 [Lapillicoccus sp.]